MNKLIIAAIITTLIVPGCAVVEKTIDKAADENNSVVNTIDKAAKEKGAVKTPSGMVFRSIQEGSGISPNKTNTVEVNYRGTLSDGTEFDSNNHIKFKLSRVIPCWTEGLQMMQLGGKAQLVCPPELAYGKRGAGRNVPPNATLIFEVELLDIQ
jgi:FKBP-type peptidyl-prolyl cis-trans isomerase FkpA